SLLREINRWLEEEGEEMVIAFDEAQLLRAMKRGKGGMDFRKLLAYAYDNLERIKFVLTGSEVGLLMDFVGSEDRRSPLHGRYREEIALRKFDRETSLEFLRRGFREQGIDPSPEVLERAVDSFDGVVGWLTYFGHAAVSAGRLDGDVLERVVNEAKRVIEAELAKVFQRSKYYRLILQAIGAGNHRWVEIKRTVEAWSGVYVSNAQLTRLLRSLEKLSIVEKVEDSYFLSDPLIGKAVGL
ncbi:MAG: ATP-binding protein, partial [Aigarchaeota archaeon]|nr:ATP-binding protein [Aigarchaeota archaeon]